MTAPSKVAWPVGQVVATDKAPTRLHHCEVKGCAAGAQQRVAWYAGGATEKRVAFLCNPHATARLNDPDEPALRECTPLAERKA